MLDMCATCASHCDFFFLFVSSFFLFHKRRKKTQKTVYLFLFAQEKTYSSFMSTSSVTVTDIPVVVETNSLPSVSSSVVDLNNVSTTEKQETKDEMTKEEKKRENQEVEIIRPVHILPVDVNEKHKKGMFGYKWKNICKVFFLLFFCCLCLLCHFPYFHLLVTHALFFFACNVEIWSSTHIRQRKEIYASF